MPRVVLDEVVDDAGLTRLAWTISGDATGMAEFGDFYGRAAERLGPLLGNDRRAWVIVADGGDAGFLDADLEDGVIGLSWFVRESERGRGVVRSAVGRLFGLAPWPEAEAYSASIAPTNAASTALARATGFEAGETNEHGEIRWRRPLPRARAGGDDPRRFLDRGGRIVAWPTRPGARRALLEWLVTEVLPGDKVIDERELGERLMRIVDDPAFARRALVDVELVERTRSGSEYARVTQPG